jgi:ribonuclease HI
MSPYTAFKKINVVAATLNDQKIVMSGFRSKELAELIVSLGGRVLSSVSSNTTIVIVKNKNATTDKINKARQHGAEIMTEEEFRNKYVDAKKYYAVKKGRTTGIFTTWDECKKQTAGVSGAQFKSFTSKTEAEKYLEKPVNNILPDADHVYFDGSAYNGRAGGACYNVNTGQTFRQRVEPATNNRGELTGLILALENTTGPVNIFGDSMYAINIGSGAVKPVANLDLVEKVNKLVKNRKISWSWVEAHRGDKWNEYVDKEAKRASLASDFSVHYETKK